MTSSGDMTTSRLFCVLFSMHSINSRAAHAPISLSGCRTVVSCGYAIRAAITSSKPTTEISSGTRSPASRNLCMAPIARISLKATIAVKPEVPGHQFARAGCTFVKRPCNARVAQRALDPVSSIATLPLLQRSANAFPCLLTIPATCDEISTVCPKSF